MGQDQSKPRKRKGGVSSAAAEVKLSEWRPKFEDGENSRLWESLGGESVV